MAQTGLHVQHTWPCTLCTDLDLTLTWLWPLRWGINMLVSERKTKVRGRSQDLDIRFAYLLVLRIGHFSGLFFGKRVLQWPLFSCEWLVPGAVYSMLDSNVLVFPEIGEVLAHNCVCLLHREHSVMEQGLPSACSFCLLFLLQWYGLCCRRSCWYYSSRRSCRLCGFATGPGTTVP